MAYIKTLKDNELIGGTDNTDVYPVSTTQALFSQYVDPTDHQMKVRMSKTNPLEPEKLEERLEGNESDAKELHRKTEKLVVYLENNQANKTLEITGTDNVMTLTGSAKTETYGDEPAETVDFGDMTLRRLTISSSGATLVEVNNWNGNYNYTVPNVVGSYVSRFEVTYNGVTRNASNTVNVNLRKYFGFAATQPTDPTTLGVSHGPSDVNYAYNYGVACTVTIPASGTGFKNIWFAVPNGMSITRVVQPDALNAPLAITYIDTINRNIDGVNYVYKLYKSDDLIDSSVSKRLTIS